MKIALAQIQSEAGDIEKNIKKHIEFISKAKSYKADLVIFPELSLTNYEPTLAKSLAMNKDDSRLDVFQQTSTRDKIIIAVSMPGKSEKGVLISLIFFQPDKQRIVYSKKYLHEDEEPFFVPGENIVIINVDDINIAPAICYEISIPEHAATANTQKASIYLASSAKTAAGMEKSIATLSETARKYSMDVLICNSIGLSDDFIAWGRSTVFNKEGKVIGQLPHDKEGLLIYDTKKHAIEYND